jgi:tRNA modification GTPase
MPKGCSYTREDVVEIHFPANEELCRLMLERCHAMGARPAEPGEFTRRAFLNGRLKLNQAQAVAALISAGDEEQRRQAMQLMGSGQGDLLKEMKDAIFIFRRNLEAVIDFPEEPDVGLQDWRWQKDMDELNAKLMAWKGVDDRRFESSSALRVLLLGPANAGKSSLVRRLIPGSQPVVSHLPGTTLDLVPYALETSEGPVHLFDSPGLKDIENHWDELSLGQLKDRLASFDAYLLLEPVGADKEIHWPDLPEFAKVLRLMSKWDCRSSKSSSLSMDEVLPVSSFSGVGIDELFGTLSDWCRELRERRPSPFAAMRKRLLACIEERMQPLRELLLNEFPEEELAAYELDDLLDELYGLAGEEGGSEALLDGIFRDFCIGK